MRLWLPLVALAAALGFAVGGTLVWGFLDSTYSWRVTSEQDDARNPNQESSDQKTGTRAHPLVVEILPTGDDKAKARQDAENENAKANRERHVLIATWIVAAATFVLAFGTVLVATYTYSLWMEARDNTQRRLRAYPGITGASIRLAEGKIGITIDVKNFSPTPARKYRWALSHDFRERSSRKDLTKPIDHGIQWDMVTNSHSSLYNKDREEISPEVFADVISHRKDVVISGRVDYVDIFGCPRYITFRYRDGPWRQETWIIGGLPRRAWLSEWLIPEEFDSN